MNKDSLEMTDTDREVILRTVRNILLDNAPIVITHGTDTMVETGLYLQRALTDLKIPIILTGAMTPLGFEGSDGLPKPHREFACGARNSIPESMSSFTIRSSL